MLKAVCACCMQSGAMAESAGFLWFPEEAEVWVLQAALQLLRPLTPLPFSKSSTGKHTCTADFAQALSYHRHTLPFCTNFKKKHALPISKPSTGKPTSTDLMLKHDHYNCMLDVARYHHSCLAIQTLSPQSASLPFSMLRCYHYR